MLKKNSLVSDSVIYISASIIQTALQFLLLPYLVRVLTVEQYGQLELFFTFNSVFLILVLFGSNNRIYEIANEYNIFKNNDDISAYKKDEFGFVFINCIILLVVSLVVNLCNGFSSKYLIYAALSAGLYSFTVLRLAITQIRKESKIYFSVTCLSSVVISLLSVLLIGVFDFGYEGRIVPVFFVYSIVLLFFSTGLKFRFRLNLSNYLHHIVLLSSLAFTAVMSWMAESVDKVMINNMLSASELAVYAVGYKFGMVILIISTALSRVWMPHVVENKGNLSFIQRRLFALSLISVLFILIYILILNLTYGFIVTAEYSAGLLIANVISIAYFFDSVSKLYNAIFIVENKMKYYLYLTIFSGVANVCFNYFLIPSYGITGAAISTLLSFMLPAIISVFLFYSLRVK